MEKMLWGMGATIVMGIGGFLASVLPAIVMPPECYVWFSNKHRKLITLLSVLLWPLTSLWGALPVFVAPAVIREIINSRNILSRPDYAMEVCCLLLAFLGPAALVLLLRLTLKWLWKPTQEMLAYNETVAAEAKEWARQRQEAKERARIAKENPGQVRGWKCPVCHANNWNEQPTCTKCGEGCRPLEL